MTKLYINIVNEKIKITCKLQFYINNKTINQLIIYIELCIKINILYMLYFNKNSFLITIQLWKTNLLNNNNIENLEKQKKSNIYIT